MPERRGRPPLPEEAKKKKTRGRRANPSYTKGAENKGALEMQREAGARLRYLRNLVDPPLSQVQLGVLLDQDQSTIAKWEDGTYLIHPYKAQVICNRFRVTLDFLYRGLLSGEVHRVLAIRIAKEAPELVRLEPKSMD